MFFYCMGDSANAVPRYQKLHARVTHIWGNRRGQHCRSAMAGLALGEPPSWSWYPLRQVSMLELDSLWVAWARGEVMMEQKLLLDFMHLYQKMSFIYIFKFVLLLEINIIIPSMIKFIFIVISEAYCSKLYIRISLFNTSWQLFTWAVAWPSNTLWACSE